MTSSNRRYKDLRVTLEKTSPVFSLFEQNFVTLKNFYERIMSAEYKDQDVGSIAQAAERDLNSPNAKRGHSTSDTSNTVFPLRVNTPFTNYLTALESGVNAGIALKFPGSAVVVGSATSGAGDNREIPVEEGGDIDEDGR